MCPQQIRIGIVSSKTRVRNPGFSAELEGCSPELGLAALTNNWYAIQHLLADLKADTEIAIAAVTEMQMACSLFLGLMAVLGRI